MTSNDPLKQALYNLKERDEFTKIKNYIRSKEYGIGTQSFIKFTKAKEIEAVNSDEALVDTIAFFQSENKSVPYLDVLRELQSREVMRCLIDEVRSLALEKDKAYANIQQSK